MTNLEKWFKFTDGLPSPDNYRLWSWLFTVSAALQRRVWCPPAHDRLFPSMYVTLVGKPGIGKDGVIRASRDMLTYHKLEDAKHHDALTDEEKLVVSTIHDKDVKLANEQMTEGGSKEQTVDKALLFPSTANAITYEALVSAMSKSIRRINYHDEKDGKRTMGIYSHSSVFCLLGEMASLFKKHTESLVNFLIEAYDCNESYEYVTISRGRDRIRRLCLNFMAGTTPDFMNSTFDDKLLNQGFSSRCIYVYAHKNRRVTFFRPELGVDVAEYKVQILEHIRKLSHLYGQVVIAPETEAYLQAWAEEDAANPHKRSSKSVKLEAYYARKCIHIMKVAMALHFGESLGMEIPLETFKRAIAILNAEETTMHLALTMNGSNPLHNASIKIVEYLRSTGQHSFVELLAEFWGKVRQSELEEILTFLETTDQVVQVKEPDPHTQEIHIYYKIKI